MKIEIWSDVVCAWCGVGSRYLDEAVRTSGQAGAIEVVHRSFQLAPDGPQGVVEKVADLVRRKSGMSDAQIDQTGRDLTKMGQEAGFTEYHVIDNMGGHTGLAHEFLAWASKQGKHEQAWKLLFEGYFSLRAPIWTIEDLLPFATQLGLNREDARAALQSHRYREVVELDQAEAIALGASGVPFIAIDRRYFIAGAQPSSRILAVIEKALLNSSHEQDSGQTCTAEGCSIAP